MTKKRTETFTDLLWILYWCLLWILYWCLIKPRQICTEDYMYKYMKLIWILQWILGKKMLGDLVCSIKTEWILVRNLLYILHESSENCLRIFGKLIEFFYLGWSAVNCWWILYETIWNCVNLLFGCWYMFQNRAILLYILHESSKNCLWIFGKLIEFFC
jgi:hypothetical protein